MGDGGVSGQHVCSYSIQVLYSNVVCACMCMCDHCIHYCVRELSQWSTKLWYNWGERKRALS